MSTKPKRVVINDPIDENTEYLVPLSDPSNRTQITKNPQVPTGVFGAIFFPVTLLLYVGVPISQLVIGLIYINKCTIQQFISPYMILSGICGIAFVVVGLIIYRNVTKKTSTSLSYDISPTVPKNLKILIPILIVLLLSVIGWFFAGQVIVFEIKQRVEFFDPTLPEYCPANLYKAAYILIFVDYLIFLIGIVLNVLSCMGAAEEPKTDPKNPTRNGRK